jgi:hypothetical protein
MSNSFYKNTNVKYFTHTLTNNTPQDDQAGELLNAEIDTQLNSALVANGAQWVMAVERFSINMNGIPFFDPTTDINNGALFRMINDNTGIAEIAFPFDYPVYSLMDLLISFNNNITNNVGGNMHHEPFFHRPNGVPTSRFYARLQFDGRVVVAYNAADGQGWYNWTLELPPQLNRILGLYEEDKPTAINGKGPINQWKSRYSRWDCSDFANTIRISSNIGVTSDNVGGGQTNILTDIKVPTVQHTMTINAQTTGLFTYDSDVTLTDTPRQTITYNPDRLRWLNIVNPSPIYQLVVSASYVDDQNNSVLVPLPLGCSFEIKLAFFNRG